MRQIRVAGLLAAFLIAPSAVAQSLFLVPVPSGSGGKLHGVSADGLTTAGYHGQDGGVTASAFTWSAANGRRDLIAEPGSPNQSAAYAISGDGGAVVGSAFTAGQTPIVVFRNSIRPAEPFFSPFHHTAAR